LRFSLRGLLRVERDAAEGEQAKSCRENADARSHRTTWTNCHVSPCSLVQMIFPGKSEFIPDGHLHFYKTEMTARKPQDDEMFIRAVRAEECKIALTSAYASVGGRRRY
jgi:hypothetical protein